MGNRKGECTDSPTGLSPSVACNVPEAFGFGHFCNSFGPPYRAQLQLPRPRDVQRIRASTHARFGLIPFRSPLLRKSKFLFFPGGTEMFHFSPFSPMPYGFRHGSPAKGGRGFPIRRSPDQRLLDTYPELIAACHVLLRLLTPRHPPCTLSSLTSIGRRSVVRTSEIS